MPGHYIKPPFDRGYLETLRAVAWGGNRRDISGTIAWLLRHPRAELMKESIVRAWQSSSLVLCSWAKRIIEVRAYVSEPEVDLRLAISLNCAGQEIVFQEPPLTKRSMENLIRGFPADPPPILQELATVAPGLSVRSTGYLAGRECFVDGLGRIRRWMDSIGEVSKSQHNLLSAGLMEVAGDGSGNYFILDLDGALSFWNHEDPMHFRACRVGLEHLIEAYLNNPSCLFDNDFLGLAPSRQPSTSVEEANQETYGRSLSELVSQLTTLANAALAVRACRRRNPLYHLDAVPLRVTQHVDRFDQLLFACLEVCSSSRPLDVTLSEKAHHYWEEAMKSWCRTGCSTHEAAILAGVYMTHIESLLHCLANLEDSESLRNVAQRCGSTVNLNPTRWWPATLGDAEYLLSLNLGPPGGLGTAIPLEFFDRPLWTDQIQPTCPPRQQQTDGDRCQNDPSEKADGS
jgi:hypothetical protein